MAGNHDVDDHAEPPLDDHHVAGDTGTIRVYSGGGRSWREFVNQAAVSPSDPNVSDYDRRTSWLEPHVPWPPNVPPPWCHLPPPANTTNSNTTTSSSIFSVFNCKLKQRRDVPRFTRHVEHVRPKIAIVSFSSSAFIPTRAPAGATPAPPTTTASHFRRRNRWHRAPKQKRRVPRDLSPTAKEDLRRMSFANKIAYAQRHGYDLIVEDESVADRELHGNNLAWAKLRAIKKWLPRYEWVVWMDHDLVIANMSAAVESVVHGRVPELEGMLARRDGREMRRYRTKKYYKFGTNINRINLDSFPISTANDSSSAKIGPRLAMAGNHRAGRPTSHKMKKQIDLLIIAEPQGTNTGVFFIRNTTWSLDFLERLHSDLPDNYTQMFPLWEQDHLQYMLNLRAPYGQIVPQNPNVTQVAMDRAHVYVDENSAWNKLWVGFLGHYGRLKQVHRDWIFEHEMDNITPSSGMLRRNIKKHHFREPRGDGPSVVVHFAACKIIRMCLAWMRYEFEHAMTVGDEAEFAPTAHVPTTYFPPDK